MHDEDTTPEARRDAFAAHIERLINASAKSQIQIADALGYGNANIITMFKKGTTRVPLDKVIPLAVALDVDPGELIRKWFDAYMPGVLPQLEIYTGMALSSREMSWVRGLRNALGRIPRFSVTWSEPIRKLVASETSDPLTHQAVSSSATTSGAAPASDRSDAFMRVVELEYEVEELRVEMNRMALRFHKLRTGSLETLGFLVSQGDTMLDSLDRLTSWTENLSKKVDAAVAAGDAGSEPSA